MNQYLERPKEDLFLSDDNVEQMLILAERLREANGVELDESAILAVAEATGAPPDYVRLAIKLRAEREKKGLLANLRSQYRILEPGTRRYLLSGVSATMTAMLCMLDARVADWLHTLSRGATMNYGIFTMLGIIAFTLGIYNVALSRDMRRAAFSGGILLGGHYMMNSVFMMLFGLPANVDTVAFPFVTLAGVGGGMLIYKLAERYRSKLGLKDPVKERQDLLKQLGELQDKLNSGRQLLTFLSIDVVGSTRMKEAADPLAVEYTFNEYYEYVARITRKHGGQLHSTAGDGITCAFEDPQHAFAASKNIQTGIAEWNAFRNRIGVPLTLRCGIHTGPVLSPKGGDVTAVNFSHVIDLAAHLQKIAPVGGIAVSEDAAAQISGGAQAIGSRRASVGEIDAVIWTPRQVLPLPKSMDLPSIPHPTQN